MIIKGIFNQATYIFTLNIIYYILISTYLLKSYIIKTTLIWILKKL